MSRVLTEMCELLELYCLAGRRKDAATGKCVPRRKHSTAKPSFHAFKKSKYRTMPAVRKDPTS
jgi:hypothetical protein